MYRHPQAIRDLCRYLATPHGPLGPETLAALDLSTVEKLPAEWVTVDFRRRHGDQVWRIRFRDAAEEAGAEAWLLLLLEFQSRDDTDMALRMLGYVVELYRDLEAQGVVRPGTRRPPVLPVVVHNGESPWGAPVEVAELIALPEVPAQVRRDLAELQPSQRLHDDTYALRARGSILHDFYNGIERVFVRIARELNGGVPRSEQWHRELIRNMALEIPAVRPAVIDADLAGTLEEYLRFRQVFRNVYGAVLSAGRMRSLEARMPATLEAFRNQVRSFLAWMLGGE